MTVWVENPQDGGSAVWCCDTCRRGNWCWSHADARSEAKAHARHHGITIVVLSRHHGPHANETRDSRIRRLRAQGNSLRAIAVLVGLTHAGVRAALRRAVKETT